MIAVESLEKGVILVNNQGEKFTFHQLSSGMAWKGRNITLIRNKDNKKVWVSYSYVRNFLTMNRHKQGDAIYEQYN